MISSGYIRCNISSLTNLSITTSAEASILSVSICLNTGGSISFSFNASGNLVTTDETISSSTTSSKGVTEVFFSSGGTRLVFLAGRATSSIPVSTGSVGTSVGLSALLSEGQSILSSSSLTILNISSSLRLSVIVDDASLTTDDNLITDSNSAILSFSLRLSSLAVSTSASNSLRYTSLCFTKFNNSSLLRLA